MTKTCSKGWWQDISLLFDGGWLAKWKENKYLCRTELWNQIATAYSIAAIVAAFSAAITRQVAISIMLPFILTTLFLMPNFWSLPVTNDDDGKLEPPALQTYNVRFAGYDDTKDTMIQKRDTITDLCGNFIGLLNSGTADKREKPNDDGPTFGRQFSVSGPGGKLALTAKERAESDRSRKALEGFVDSPPVASRGTEEGFTLPSASNPFMNVDPTEQKYNPFRSPAADIDDPSVKKYLDNFFRVQWFSDPTDVFGKNQGQRQFYTMPSTSIPSDEKSFRDWLYKLPFKTCKEGGREACVPGSGGGYVPWLQINEN